MVLIYVVLWYVITRVMMLAWIKWIPLKGDREDTRGLNKEIAFDFCWYPFISWVMFTIWIVNCISYLYKCFVAKWPKLDLSSKYNKLKEYITK